MIKFFSGLSALYLFLCTLAVAGTPLPQTLTFDPIPTQVYGADPFILEATSSSPLMPKYEVVSGPAKLNGRKITLTGAGVVKVKAYQPGSVAYLPAKEVVLTFRVSRATQAITFSALPSQPFGTASVPLSATASSQLPVTLEVTTGPGTLSGNVLTFTGAGTVSVRATQPGDTNYQPAKQVVVKAVVEHLPQTISFATIPDSPFTTTPLALSATATSGLPVRFAVIKGPATITDRLLTYTGAGTVLIEASQPGTSVYAPAVAVRQTLHVTRSAQTVDFPPLADRPANSAPFPLIATASSGLPVSYVVRGPATLANNVVTLTGSGRVVVETRQTGSVNFLPAATVRQSFTSTVPQIITFPALADLVYTTAPQALHATSSAGTRIIYQVISGPARIDGSRFFVTGVGAVVIEANAEAHGAASAASPVRCSFNVLAKSQTITFPEIGPQTMGNAPINLTATASSGLPVTYSIAGPATLSGQTAAFTGLGFVEIIASQEGNGIFAAASTVTRTVQVLDSEVRLPAIFGDHMVLQQQKTLPIWGTAKPGQKITVTLKTQVATTTTDAKGHWRVDLTPLGPTSTPLTLTVTGVGTRIFTDVLVGDVWLCSGQSNMAFRLDLSEGAEYEVPEANRPQIRLFMVEHKASIRTQADVKGTWKVCTPETAATFSAIGYYFGSQINTRRNYPIGLIGSHWEGTPAEAWCGLGALKSDPVLKNYADDYADMLADYPDASAEYAVLLAAYNQKLAEWNATEGVRYTAAIRAWVAAVKLAKALGQTPPKQPVANPPEPKAPLDPEGDQYTPTAIYRCMIDPLIPFAIKGVLWYQGEANVGKPDYYAQLFQGLITDWRKQWAQGDFPFLFVQVSTFTTENNRLWPFLREGQMKALILPHTGMAVSVDVGDPDYLHPPDKFDVADRLVLAARKVAYGENIVSSGPMYTSMVVEGAKIRLHFTSVGSGLVIANSPWHPANQSALSTTDLVGFLIAGADQKWVEAKAVIQGNDVVVSSPSVAAPVAVRYLWENAPRGNLYNQEGLPAPPFRTDAYPILKADR